MDEQVGRVLTDLIETLEDGRKGFSHAAERLAEAGRHDLAGSMRDFSVQRQRFSLELRELAADHGLHLEANGSLAGSLHRRWMALREALTSDDASGVLTAAEGGEDHAKDEYSKALDAELPEGVRMVLARQAAAVIAAHDEVRAMRDRGVVV